MARRLGAVVAVVFLAGLVAATVPAGAGAQVDDPWDKLQTGTAQANEKQRWWNFNKGFGYSDANAKDTIRNIMGNEKQRRNFLRRMVKGRIGSRLFPAAPMLARLTLIGTAGYVGWTVYQHYTNGDKRTYDMWLNHRLTGRNSLYNPEQIGPEYKWQRVEWLYRSGVGQNGCPSALGYEPCARLQLRIQMTPYVESWQDEYPYYVNEEVGTGQVESGRITIWQTPDYEDCLDDFAGCLPLRSPSHPVKPPDYRRHIVAAITWTQERLSGDGFELAGGDVDRVETIAAGKFDNNAGDVGPLYGAYITPEQFEQLHVPDRETVTAGGTGTNAAPENSTTYNVPADQGTPADLEESLEPWDDECGRAFVNWYMEPQNYPEPDGICFGTAEPDLPDNEGETFALPRPDPGETYDDYLARLQAEGHVGTITRVDLTEETGDPRMGPEGIVRIKARPAGGTVTTYSPLAWPGTSPTVEADSPITLHVNPPSYAPTTPGAIPPGGGECDATSRRRPIFRL